MCVCVCVCVVTGRHILLFHYERHPSDTCSNPSYFGYLSSDGVTGMTVIGSLVNNDMVLDVL